MAEYEINEETACFLEMRFKDEHGTAVIPTSGNYRIDDMTGLTDTITGTLILAETPFVPATSKYTIIIPASLNAILNDVNVYEDRQVTVRWIYVSGGVSDVFSYRVKNLSRVS